MVLAWASEAIPGDAQILVCSGHVLVLCNAWKRTWQLGVPCFLQLNWWLKVGGGGGGGVATGLLNKGGGSNRLPGLVTKQQAVEFPQVQTSLEYYVNT